MIRASKAGRPVALLAATALQLIACGQNGGAQNGGATGRATGGSSATGGVSASPTGGSSSGGASAASGGSSATGGVGTAATGGTTASGGALAAGGTGGASATGGVSGQGGMVSTGGRGGNGTTGSGGVVATAGTSGATGPVLVSTIDLKGASGCPGLRLGDINGDGKLELVVAQPVDQNSLDSYTPQRVVAVTAFDLKGNQLWQYGTPNKFHTASSDIPVQVYDMDGDGKSEIFVNMSTTEMTVLDGTTGKVMRKIPLPEAGSNDSIAFTNLRGTAWPQDIIVKTRYSQFWAITGMASDLGPAGTVLWTHKKGPATGFSDLSTGHYPLVYDWNGDGKDEVMGGYDFMDSGGRTLWSSTTLKLHADSIATGDMDGNPANGKEIVICGDVAAAYDWKTGTRLWQDTHTTEVQQMGMGDYRPDLPGLEVALLDRLRTDAEGMKSNNWLLDRNDKVLWHEDRPNNSGWLTVTENLNNWDGTGGDLIFSYRRGNGGAFLYDGYQKTVASFAYPGKQDQNFAEHADVCGDSREEVIVYDETTAWIYANGGCDLNAPPLKPSLPQQYHLYNWSIYTGWINPDPKFYTPGSKQ